MKNLCALLFAMAIGIVMAQDYASSVRNPPGSVQILRHHAYCTNRGGRAGGNRYSKNIGRNQPLSKCADVVRANPACSPYFSLGRDGWCDCVAKGRSSCTTAPWSHYTAAKITFGYSVLRRRSFCFNRGGSAGRNQYSTNVGRSLPLQNCAKWVRANAACSAYFSIGADGWCDCVPQGQSSCAYRPFPGYTAVRLGRSGCWTRHAHKFLGGYVGGIRINDLTLRAAQERCDSEPTCGGVTRERSGRFTVRVGPHMGNSPSGEISWIRCGMLQDEEGAEDQTILNLSSAHAVTLLAVAVAVVVALVAAVVVVRRRRQVTEEEAVEEQLAEELLA